jgi:exonuclease SbcC
VSPADRSLADRLPALEQEQTALWEEQARWREWDKQRTQTDVQKSLKRREVEAATAQVRQAEDKLAEAQTALMQAQTGGPCPTCGQAMPSTAVEELQGRLQIALEHANRENVRLLELRADLADMPDPPPHVPEPQPRPELLDLIKQAKAVADRAARADERLAMAAQWTVDADAVNQRVAELAAEQIEAERALSGAQAGYDAEAGESARQRRDIAQIALQDAERRVAEERQRLVVLEDRNRRLVELATERDARASDAYDLGQDLAAAQLLERAYGRNGVPALIMEQSAIPTIEATANRVLTELGTDFTCTLQTQRELRGGGTADALDVLVHSPTGDAMYEDLSGGERTRVDIALRLGLSQLMVNRKGAEVRYLAMDEPAHLDEEGMQRLGMILADLQGFDRILLVSHVPTLGDAFDQRLVVGRDGDDASVLSDASMELVSA